MVTRPMTHSSAALGMPCRISFNPSPVAPLTNSPNHDAPSATLVLTRFLMSIRQMGTARCRPCGTIIPSRFHRRCASPRRFQRQCGSRVRYGSQTNAVSALIFLPTFFFFCPYVSPLRLSAVVCRCRIFACSNIRIVGWLRSDSICSPCGPSMGLVPQHVYLDRHACSGAVQRFQRSHRAQLCICVCSHQHRNPGTYSLRPHSSVIPSLFEISFPSLPFTSIFLLLREAVSLMLSLYADLRLGCIPATCHQDPQA